MCSPVSVRPITDLPGAQLVVAAASITSSYTRVGSANFLAGVRSLIITSTLDQPVQLSFDGVTDHLPILMATNGTVTPVNLNGAVLPGYLGVWVKEIGNPTTGNLYISYFKDPNAVVVSDIPTAP